jgi:hypothetical protein
MTERQIGRNSPTESGAEAWNQKAHVLTLRVYGTSCKPPGSSLNELSRYL